MPNGQDKGIEISHNGIELIIKKKSIPSYYLTSKFKGLQNLNGSSSLNYV